MGQQLLLPLRLSGLALLLAAVVVTLGAYTRLVNAGLGCPDWPGCYGFIIVPHTDHHLALAAERFPDMPVEAHKGWAEMIHRYAAGLLGLMILVLNVLAWRKRSIQSYPIGLSGLLLVLVVIQALFGMWTVTLKLWPQVVTLHLLGGFATLALVFLLRLRLRQLLAPPQRMSDMHELVQTSHLRGLVSVALFFVVLQVALGGWTSANYAAFACPDFPMCQGQWWPEMSIHDGLNIGQSVGPNYLGGHLDGEGRVAIHSVHRLGALVVTGIVMVLVIALWRFHRHGQAMMLGCALLLQLAIGIANVLWQFPLALALAHNSGAALLLLTLVWLRYRLHVLGEPDAITQLVIGGIYYEKSSSY